MKEGDLPLKNWKIAFFCGLTFGMVRSLVPQLLSQSFFILRKQQLIVA